MSTRFAAALIRHYAGSHAPDQRTSMADARIALCLAAGTDMDDIDPASGYDYSQRAYNSSRQSWIDKVKYHRFSEWYDREPLNETLANWAAHRPDATAGDDWLAAGIEAHRTYWAGIGRTCNRDSCELR
ncbi:hypothetical protein [Streptomyces sp.]|uniref:hypothetical protein n=1 Tax=Streptomyces sp. TaxID=1931 RepID=UPI002F423CB1